MLNGKKLSFSLILTFLFIAIGIYGFLIEPEWIAVTHLQVNEINFHEVLKGKKAIHLTDLHIDRIGRRERRILEMIEQIRPDLIFLTGDYVKWDGNFGPALEFLSKLTAEIGVWAVMGDYDYSNSRKSCLFCHKQGTGEPTQQNKIRFLRNSFDFVDFPAGKIWIAGIDKEFDRPFVSDDPIDLNDESFPIILLTHNPLAFDQLQSDRVTLVLAGDTHGGQIPLPSWLWKLIGYEKTAKYNQGLFKEDHKMMYVSRGVGTSHWPIRLFRRPELVVLHF